MSKKIDIELIQNSIKLDTKIYIKLSGILINKILEFKLDLISSPNYNFSNIMKTDFNSTTEKDINESLTLENKKIKKLIEVFDQVNKERLALRESLILLIKKKFWKITENKNNSDFFVNKIKGLDLEVMKKRIEKLENLCKEKDSLIQEKDKIIQEIQNENFAHLERIKKQSSYLKDSILNNSVNNSIISIGDTSINNFNGTGSESNHHSKAKSTRKFKRKNSHFVVKNEEPKQPAKMSLFKNQRKIKARKFLKDHLENSFNINNTKTKFELSHSSEDDNEINFKIGKNHINLRKKKSFR